MKNIIISTLLVLLSFMSFSQEMDLFMPPTNAKIIQYVNKNVGKQVDKGECWDLAYRALEFANAKHLDTYVFGRKLNKTEEIFSGDIIQFEKVKIEVPLEGEDGFMVHEIPHHTAIIYEVLGKLKFKIADQNNGITGKKVSVHELDLNFIKSGKYIIFRPLKK